MSDADDLRAMAAILDKLWNDPAPPGLRVAERRRVGAETRAFYADRRPRTWAELLPYLLHHNLRSLDLSKI